jgi:hypothetical protein
VIPDKGLVTASLKGSPYTFAPCDAGKAREFVDWRARGFPGEQWTLTPAPTCRCCGEPAWPNLRCTKHQDRNPCVVPGCIRTMPAHGWLRDDAFLCGEHWKLHVPPGSPVRRAFNRLGRLARRMGYRRHDQWPEDLQARRWRLWCGVVRRVRRGPPDGHIDVDAIHRMFGLGHEG